MNNIYPIKKDINMNIKYKDKDKDKDIISII